MSEMIHAIPKQLSGGCMSGAVRYKISDPPIARGLCHCNRCRPQSGSAFSTAIIIKRSTIMLDGETAVFEDIGASGFRVANVGPNEQSFIDAFNTQMLPLTQSG
jgi:hypothetical protein